MVIYWQMARPNPLEVPERRKEFCRLTVFMSPMRACRNMGIDYPTFLGWKKRRGGKNYEELLADIEIAKSQFINLIGKNIEDRLKAGMVTVKDSMNLLALLEPDQWGKVHKHEHKHSVGVQMLDGMNQTERRRLSSDLVKVLGDGKRQY